MRNGAGDGVRTHGLDLGKVALYQLSYARGRGKQRKNIFFCQLLFMKSRKEGV